MFNNKVSLQMLKVCCKNRSQNIEKTN